MIQNILKEENNSIRDLLLLRCKYLKPNQRPTQKLYIAISEYNNDLGTITDDPCELEKFEGFEEEYFFYVTTPIKLLYLNEILTKKITKEIAEQILIILALQLTDTELDDHLSAIGLTQKDYTNLLTTKVETAKGITKVYSKQTLLESFNITLSEYKIDQLITEVGLEDIIDE